jgi:N-acetylglucosaminyldiphosphoundecaprenol N-acetyl-beta-D-mannosaminyltransferase
MMTSEKFESEPVWVWGVPFAPLTLTETLETVSILIEKGKPAFFITANTHYAMLTRENADLQEINTRAAFVVADGAPLVLVSRRRAIRLPERVAGSDLIFELSALAARKNYRLFLAGGGPGVADEAAHRLTERYPGLQIVGSASPRFRNASQAEYEALKAQIKAARPHILIVAATMPLGERWLDTHLSDLGVPVGVNLGASIDFAADRIRRAPRWMQKTGLEWAFRLMLEPRRLFSRYARNAWFIFSSLVRDLSHRPGESQTFPRSPASPPGSRRQPR